jgi:hypothetical protein
MESTILGGMLSTLQSTARYLTALYTGSGIVTILGIRGDLNPIIDPFEAWSWVPTRRHLF